MSDILTLANAYEKVGVLNAGTVDRLLRGELSEHEVRATIDQARARARHTIEDRLLKDVLGQAPPLGMTKGPLTSPTFPVRTGTTYPMWKNPKPSVQTSPPAHGQAKPTSSAAGIQQINNMFRDALSKIIRGQPLPLAGPSIADMLEGVEEPPKPELPVEDTTEPLVGYRAWNVERAARWVREPTARLWDADEPEMDAKTEECFLLQSPIRHTFWCGPILRAEAPPSPWNPHRHQGVHGIYANDEPDWYAHGSSSQPRAMGRVELTGQVVVHDSGYRAEACRITKLVLNYACLGYRDDGIIEDMERTYGCDVSFDISTLEEA